MSHPIEREIYGAIAAKAVGISPAVFAQEVERWQKSQSHWPSLEAVLNRLLTAKALKEDADGWDIEAEVFGKGIEMWLRSQGENVVKEWRM